MDSTAGIDIERIRQLNKPGYIRTRLTASYIIIFAISACIGSLLNSRLGENLYGGISERLSAIFLPPAAGEFSSLLIYEIIYNAVDIFKISFIILIAGFSYISGVIDRAAALLTGFYYGFAASLSTDLILSRDYYSGGGAWALTSLFILRFILLSSVIIACCVISETYSDYWKRYRNVGSIIKSWHFWKYSIIFLILFGYVILAETAYRYILKIIL